MSNGLSVMTIESSPKYRSASGKAPVIWYISYLVAIAFTIPSMILVKQDPEGTPPNFLNPSPELSWTGVLMK